MNLVHPKCTSAPKIHFYREAGWGKGTVFVLEANPPPRSYKQTWAKFYERW